MFLPIQWKCLNEETCPFGDLLLLLSKKHLFSLFYKAASAINFVLLRFVNNYLEKQHELKRLDLVPACHEENYLNHS